LGNIFGGHAGDSPVTKRKMISVLSCNLTFTRGFAGYQHNQCGSLVKSVHNRGLNAVPETGLALAPCKALRPGPENSCVCYCLIPVAHHHGKLQVR
jgi:hypothetical protein